MEISGSYDARWKIQTGVKIVLIQGGHDNDCHEWFLFEGLSHWRVALPCVFVAEYIIANDMICIDI